MTHYIMIIYDKLGNSLSWYVELDLCLESNKLTKRWLLLNHSMLTIKFTLLI